MAVVCYVLLHLNYKLPVLIYILVILVARAESYRSIFSFGDSLADTGNSLYDHAQQHSYVGRLPYGETYFHHPTGRFSDGRLIIDFLAQAMGIPLLQPYLSCPSDYDFKRGVNFAVAGATALDPSFFRERGILVLTNYSLGHQINWFRQILPSLCTTPRDCREVMKDYLFIVGEIGGNDYNNAFQTGWGIEQMRSYTRLVVDAISSAIETLIDHGATTLVVPGNLPVGCSAAYLAAAQSSNKEDYDPVTGCLKKWNEFAQFQNQKLKRALDHLRECHPSVTIFYADYYNIAMQVFRSPREFGFVKGALTACCGGGGPYNVNISALCGSALAKSCKQPSLYWNWDGIHLTESAYKWMASSLIDGPHAIRHINTYSCFFM